MKLIYIKFKLIIKKYINMPTENIELIRKELIDLYLEVKIRKRKEVN